MRRSLVLTREDCRHPVRMNLPHRRAAYSDVSVAAGMPGFDWRLSAADVRGFATTYLASFAAVLAFIA